MNIAIITGASSGIGREFFKQTVDENQKKNADKKIDEFWIIARRVGRLLELKKSAEDIFSSRGEKTKVKVIEADLEQEGAEMTILEELEAYKTEGKDPKLMLAVLAAGYGKTGSLAENSYHDCSGMIKLNCLALTRMCKFCLEYAVSGSEIILIASVASFLPQPDFAIYAASKAYVYSFSHAVREEVKKRGINVIALCPGPVDTEFFERSGSEISADKIKSLGLENCPKMVAETLKRSRKGKASAVTKSTGRLIRFASKIFPLPLIFAVERKMGMFE